MGAAGFLVASEYAYKCCGQIVDCGANMEAVVAWAAVVVVLCGCTSSAGRRQIGVCAENADNIPGQCAGQKILRDSQAVDVGENGCFGALPSFVVVVCYCVSVYYAPIFQPSQI